MLDPKLIREEPDKIKENLSKRKNPKYLELVDEYIEVDEKWRDVDYEVNNLRQMRNKYAKKIGREEGDERQKLISDMKSIKEELEEKEKKLDEYGERRQWILDRIPNLLHESVPYGKDEEDNVEIKAWGQKPNLEFDPKDHHELLELLDLAELDRARKTSGARFYFLKNEAAILELAILRYALDIVKKKGRTIFSTPSMVRPRMLYGTGFLPAEEENIFKIDGYDLDLIGTSEVTLAGLHADEVFTEDQLPVRYAGFSNNFRTEASASTKDDKGIFRVHEFKKIEMFSFTLPGNSYKEQELLLEIAEEIFQGLGIHYRIVNICTGDIGAVAARKYDIEAWLPGQKRYREVVSCSNCTDYQSRRLMIRYRGKEGSPIKGYVHTLNSTAITSTRPIIAILENYQQEDGTVLIPKVLRPYTGFDKISPKL